MNGAIELPPPNPEPIFDLASLLANPPTDGLIQLQSGIFTIPADGVQNKCLASKIHLKGNGPQQTTILRDPNPAYAANNQPVLWFTGDDVTVENLTLDANAGDSDIYTRGCLRMDGRNPQSIRVRGLHASGWWEPGAPGGNECFAFFVTHPDGGLISQCSLSEVRGNYVEGFCHNGMTRDCLVEYPPSDGSIEPPFYGGFQVSGSNGASIIGCTQRGGSAFLYTDTGSDSNVLIAHCSAKDVMRGIIMVRARDQSIDGLSVDNCVIELSMNASAGLGSNGIAISGPGAKRNCRFTNNLVRFVGGVGPAPTPMQMLSIAAVDGECSGTVIMGNSYDSAMGAPMAESSATIHANPVCARA